MTAPVQDMRWCRWCQATKPVDHDDCVGGDDTDPLPDSDDT